MSVAYLVSVPGARVRMKSGTQVRPSVGPTWDHCAGQPPGCRLCSCLVVCGGFTNPRIPSPSVVNASAQVGAQKTDASLGHSSISSAPQFTTSPVFSSHPFAKGGRKDGAPGAEWECGSECTSRWEPPHLCGGRSASALRERFDFDLRFSAGMEKS